MTQPVTFGLLGTASNLLLLGFGIGAAAIGRQARACLTLAAKTAGDMNLAPLVATSIETTSPSCGD